MSESLRARSEGPDGRMAGWLVERWRQRRVDLSADGDEEHTTRLRLPPRSWRGTAPAARCPSALCTTPARLPHRVWLVHHLQREVEGKSSLQVLEILPLPFSLWDGAAGGLQDSCWAPQFVG